MKSADEFGSRVKILIEMDGHCIERLSSEVMEGSAVYNLLHAGVRTALPVKGSLTPVVIVCDKDDAEKIHQAAEMFCPEVAPSIRKEIDLYRVPPE